MAVLAAGALVVKGVVIPGMMLWAMREAAIRRELEPIVGFVPSMVLGAVGVAVAFTLSASLPCPSTRATRCSCPPRSPRSGPASSWS